jgi:RNA polymerase sigma factor (sigma-70 family)
MSYEVALGFFDDAFRCHASRVNKQDVEDVKQSAILRYLTELNRQEIPECKLFNFSFTIIKRTIADHYRRQNRKIEKSTQLVGVFGESYASGGEDSVYCLAVEDSGYEVAELKADFAAHAHLFSRQERRVIELMLGSEEGQGNILIDLARELGINKSHATRALTKLRQICRILACAAHHFNYK